MAHSPQFLENRSENFIDGDIIATTKLLLLALRERGARGSLGNASSVWTNALENYGPGCVFLRLDAVLDRPEAKLEFEQLLNLVDLCISKYGEYVPGHVLNMLPPQVGVNAFSNPDIVKYIGENTGENLVVYGDFPVARIKETVDGLRRLATGS